MQLIVAEKPSQARAIADAIGVRGRGNGFIEGGNIVITWCVGHVVEFFSPENYSEQLKKWTMEALPFIPDEFKTKPSINTMEQYNILKGLMLRCDIAEIVCATDSGREGELIFDLVYRSVGCNKAVKRLWTSSLTAEALTDAYKNLRSYSEFAKLRASAYCRAQADWLIGLNSTRAQTLIAQKSGGQGVWSIGRVQTPTLNMIVEREMAIRNFVSKPFWTIEAEFLTNSGQYVGKWFWQDDAGISYQIFSKEKALSVLEYIKNKAVIVQSVSKIDEKRQPPQFFDLTSLQKEANKRFGFSAEKTLQIAQSLYEKAVLSYPRTSSKYLSSAEETTLPKILSKLPNMYQEYVKKIEKCELGKRFVDATKVEDHHAIIPTGKFAPLSKDENLVFDMVVRKVISAYFPDELLKRTIIITQVGEEKFQSIGKVIVSEGWTVVISKNGVEKCEKTNDDENRILPNVNPKDAIQIAGSKLKDGKTQPPKFMSEADILAAMETSGKKIENEDLREAIKDCGLGTPATRAAIIEGLLKREYAVRKVKNIVPTEKGIALIQSLNSSLLKSPELTGQWEAKLESICKGKLSAENFMSEIKEYTKKIISEIKGNTVASIENKEKASKPTGNTVIGKCPKCDSDLILKIWEKKFYVKCSATKNCECKLSYDSDKNGKSKGGKCKKCKQPIKITKNGGKVCVSCGEWAHPVFPP